ncbi:MAG: hypothetical protein J3Q66DRAFT_360243 [Benniella sp.]|nr:MAG: hypothetical protein J3Q66DRAFT_360243 [Benniella sp.]
MQAAPHQNPLEMPEILDIIASHLYNFDPCLRVSKLWRDVFLPHRWRHIRWTIERDGDWIKHSSLRQELLNNHRHLVQSLNIDGPPRGIDMCTYPNLHSLWIDHFMHGMKDKYNHRRVVDWDLAEKLPLLNNLSLDYVCVESQFCQALSKHHNIRNLSLGRAKVQSSAALDLLRACKNLESISFKDVRFEGEIVPIPEDIVYERMRTLELVGQEKLGYSQVLAMVFHCPALESFKWGAAYISVGISLKHPVQKIRWPRLDSLSISREPQDPEVASILRGIGSCFGSIAFLRLSGVLGLQASMALDSHSSTLVKLDFRHGYVPSAAIRDVLCSCPLLKILRAGNIAARDIAEGGPWVCQHLTELMLCVRVGKTEQGLQSLVFEHMSELVRLQRLEVPIGYHEDIDGALQFRLDCGLQHLANLKELTFVSFSQSGIGLGVQRLGIEEAKWIADNWKKLCELRGWFNEDPDAVTQMIDILKYVRYMVAQLVVPAD